jgi:hypothetical protein
MSKDTLYPSQINTKTISCRISSVDYVNFLNDALSKGITLNDWLLMKIYSQNQKKSDLIGNNDTLEDTLTFPFTLEINSEIYTFSDLDDIESFIYDSTGKISHLLEWRDIYKKQIDDLNEHIKYCETGIKVNFDNKQHRAVIFSKLTEYIDGIKWESIQDKREIKKNLKDLFNDLFS